GRTAGNPAYADPPQRCLRGVLEPAVRTGIDRPRHAYQERAAARRHRGTQPQRRTVVRAMADRDPARPAVQGVHAVLAQPAPATTGGEAAARAARAGLARTARRRAAGGARPAAAYRLGRWPGRPLATGRSRCAGIAGDLRRRCHRRLRARTRPACASWHLAIVAAPALRRDLAAADPLRTRSPRPRHRRKTAARHRAVSARTGLARVRPSPALSLSAHADRQLQSALQ